MNPAISLIIPTLNAEKYIKSLLDRLFSQTIVPTEVIVIDSQSDDRTVELCREYDRVKVIEIQREDFDHGGTRHIGFKEAKGDICLVMSQDVLPKDNYYIQNLIKAFDTDGVVMATGRQIPYPDSPLTEKITREFNYPDFDIIKDRSSAEKLGIKTYFFSDVCSAYIKSKYFALGGYDTQSLICNDMIMAAKAINAGYKTAYISSAQVYHSHKYTLKQQYKRNFDVSADMAINNKYFSDVSDTSEGLKMVRYVLKRLLSGLHFITAFYYCIECAAKFLGNRAGKKYDRMNKKQILKRTMNKSYWKRTKYVS